MLIQSKLAIIPHVETDVKWHSINDCMITWVCYSINETINATDKTINGYKIYTVHEMYSLKLSSSGQNSEELSAGARSFGGSYSSRLLSDRMLASHPIYRFSTT